MHLNLTNLFISCVAESINIVCTLTIQQDQFLVRIMIYDDVKGINIHGQNRYR